jgi:hypothetical protein
MRSSHLAVLFVLLGTVSGCAGLNRTATDAVIRPADDVPARFTTEDGIMPEDACRSPMIDPRDHTRLRLVRSAQYGMSHRGDFEVSGGRYGVGQGELLRIDCSTGDVIGIVRN